MSDASSSSSSSSSAFVEFFAHLSEEKIDALYSMSPWATLAVLRALTPLAKQYVMRCVFLPANAVIHRQMMRSWTKKGCESVHETALERLIKLRAFVEVETDEGVDGFIVHEHFRKHVKRAIERGFEDLDDDTEKENEETKKNSNKKKETSHTRCKTDREYLDH